MVQWELEIRTALLSSKLRISNIKISAKICVLMKLLTCIDENFFTEQVEVLVRRTTRTTDSCVEMSVSHEE
jgi:hypothetical protein